MAESSDCLNEFLRILGGLKLVKRSGWINQVGIEHPESVSDHGFRCAILAMCIGDLAGMNTEKLVRMLLLHDIHETITGDLDHQRKENLGHFRVRREEEDAIVKILSLLPSSLRDQYFTLWKEFQESKTSDAILANEIDKIEMVVQALEYEKQGFDSNRLQAFWDSVAVDLKSPVIKGLYESLKRTRGAESRPARSSSKGHA